MIRVNFKIEDKGFELISHKVKLSKILNTCKKSKLDRLKINYVELTITVFPQNVDH